MRSPIYSYSYIELLKQFLLALCSIKSNNLDMVLLKHRIAFMLYGVIGSIAKEQ